MSRIIVKNLPSGLKEARLRKLFAQYGTVTDCALKFNTDGVFRKFAFVGYKSDAEASEAVKHLDASFIDTTRIQVSLANDLNAVQQKSIKPSQKSKQGGVKEKSKSAGVQAEINSLDDTDPKGKSSEKIKKGSRVEKVVESDRETSEALADDSSSSSSSDDDDNKSDDDGDSAARECTDKGEMCESYRIVMRGLPSNARESQIREFFRPIKLQAILIPQRMRRKKSAAGVVSVLLSTEAERNEALRRNKNFIGSKKIYLNAAKSTDPDSKSAGKRPQLNEPEDISKGADVIAESCRLFVRNLAYCCTEADLQAHFAEFDPTEVHLPIDGFTKKIKGFAFVSFASPENAIRAYEKLDGTIFQGRMLHLIAGQAKKNQIEITDDMPFAKKKELQKKSGASSAHNWNTLFVGANAVADVMAEKYGATKSDILLKEGKQTAGVRLALGETQIVAETRQFLLDNDVALDSFSQAASERSKTVMVVKHLPAGVTSADLRAVFQRYGTLVSLLLPPSGLSALVQYSHPTEARAAFTSLAYTKHVPLYLEWAPMGVFTHGSGPAASVSGLVEEKLSETSEHNPSEQKPAKDEVGTTAVGEKGSSEASDEEEGVVEAGSTLFVKNLHFDTGEESLREMFSKYGRIREVTIARKKDLSNKGGKLLSMGYGFVAYRTTAAAMEAMKHLQNCSLDGHKLELKVSNRTTAKQETARRKQEGTRQQASTKIIVKNIPFEASVEEVKQLFGVYGELKSVRIPKKLGGRHRGFGFVDFLTKGDAKRAFNAICHSTHFYSRRLVLEWAEPEETVDDIRKKTASHYSDDGPKMKRKKSELLQELKL